MFLPSKNLKHNALIFINYLNVVPHSCKLAFHLGPLSVMRILYHQQLNNSRNYEVIKFCVEMLRKDKNVHSLVSPFMVCVCVFIRYLCGYNTLSKTSATSKACYTFFKIWFIIQKVPIQKADICYFQRLFHIQWNLKSTSNSQKYLLNLQYSSWIFNTTNT